MIGHAPPATELRILLVDDSDALCRAVRSYLEELPHVRIVGVAADADTAIERIRSLQPDVVILDLRLARSSGLTVLVAAQVLVHPPRILVLTNATDPGLRERCLTLGAQRYLDKSTEFDQVLTQVRHWADELRPPTLRGPPEG